VPDRCEELRILNQAVIDAMTEAYMVKCHLETAKQNDENTHAHALALHVALAKERQAVVVRNRHKQQHGCGGGLMRAAGF
jgi:sugar diacid utilization regulator